VRAAEGSRTKAAIGASNYGLAIKISSDGDITVYAAGKPGRVNDFETT
jgi:acylphosphatase